MYRRGISPVIATVIIVAVAVAISIAVVGWIMGLWGSIAGGTESLKIYPDSYINASANSLRLHVSNTGSAAAVIYKVEISGVAICSSTASDLTLNPGEEKWLIISDFSNSTTTWGLATSEGGTVSGSASCDFTNGATAGAYYLVKIYTRAGNVYQANVIAK